jgi:pyruvate/2-oxoglutarate dehydrogenase complex dihydrolipoamide acyltransferase (E2) component
MSETLRPPTPSDEENRPDTRPERTEGAPESAERPEDIPPENAEESQSQTPNTAPERRALAEEADEEAAETLMEQGLDEIDDTDPIPEEQESETTAEESQEKQKKEEEKKPKFFAQVAEDFKTSVEEIKKVWQNPDAHWSEKLMTTFQQINHMMDAIREPIAKALGKMFAQGGIMSAPLAPILGFTGKFGKFYKNLEKHNIALLMAKTNPPKA